MFVDVAFMLTQKTPINSNKVISGKSEITLINEPILENMPNATNEAILVIKGKADPDTQIQLYHNRKRELTTNADFDGNFQFEYVLEERNNEFSVRSVDQYSHKAKQSKLYEVVFIDEPPFLEIKNPENDKKYYEAKINIEGTTDKEVFVKINNLPIVIRADGSFSYPYTLAKGDNEITVMAEDVAGNTTEVKIKVTYVE